MKIEEFRKTAGLTQAELAAQIGVNRTTVVKWEKGESCPKGALLPKLAKALGKSLSELYTEEELAAV